MPGRRPGFNEAIWNGTKPLVDRPATAIEVGSVVWEKAPDEAQHARRGGVVVRAKVDEESGERVLTVLTADKRNGKFTCRTFDVPADEIDGALVERPTSHRLHRASREICRSLGEHALAPVVGFDRHLLEIALGLADLADQVIAETARKLLGETA